MKHILCLFGATIQAKSVRYIFYNPFPYIVGWVTKELHAILKAEVNEKQLLVRCHGSQLCGLTRYHYFIRWNILKG